MSTGKNTCSSPIFFLETNHLFLLKLKKKTPNKTTIVMKEQPMEKFSLNYYHELAGNNWQRRAEGRMH